MRIKKGLENEYASFRDMNTKDVYSTGVISYAERWCDMMEQRIDKGMSVDCAATETKYIADTEGITGFMYGCAVNTLCKFWEHGDELREWHNQKHNYDEQGAANKDTPTISDQDSEPVESSPTMSL